MSGDGGDFGGSGVSDGVGNGVTDGLGLGLFDPDPARRLSVNGAPIIEQSHEYVLKKKPDPNAPNQ